MKDEIEDSMAGTPGISGSKAFFAKEKEIPAPINGSQTSSTAKRPRPKTVLETATYFTAVVLPPTIGMILCLLPFTQMSLHEAPRDLLLNAWFSAIEWSGVVAALGVLWALRKPRFRDWAVNDTTKRWYSKFTSFWVLFCSVVPALTGAWSWLCTCRNDCTDLGDARCRVDNVLLKASISFRIWGGPTMVGIGLEVYNAIERREDKQQEARDKAVHAT
ncbi:hypothetical protein EDB81DRAFT_791987 [Dactylonectria macrodidyma]|uniref:Uncharacterized protein n=1 Tax=Dactylonectria macrodidyma TaxID=307937 RepID=A0A9P9EY99_9HYPO|nr:hypothetical protein EDB81DRAFT_791987 [Dactylonectria macrodidyma]